MRDGGWRATRACEQAQAVAHRPRRRRPCPILIISMILASAACASGSSQERSAVPPVASSSTTSIASSSTTSIAPPPRPTTATTIDPYAHETHPAEQRWIEVAGSRVLVRFDAGVPPPVVDLVSDSVARAGTAFGSSGPLTVHIYSNPDDYVADQVTHKSRSTPEQKRQTLLRGVLTAEAGFRSIWIYAPSFTRLVLDSSRQVGVIHEYFHTYQLQFEGEDKFPASSPLWLREGTAEYYSRQAAAAMGVLSVASYRTRALADLKQTPKTLKDLEGLFNTRAGEDRDAYVLGYFATEFLAKTFGQEPLRRQYWEMLATTDWRAAFTATFKMTVDAFYPEFERYRASL